MHNIDLQFRLLSYLISKLYAQKRIAAFTKPASSSLHFGYRIFCIKNGINIYHYITTIIPMIVYFPFAPSNLYVLFM